MTDESKDKMPKEGKNQLENGRAEKAYSFVKEFVDKKENLSEYKSWAKKVPSMIQMNGFGQTVAFLFSKSSKEPYKTFYNQIETWLVKKGFLNSGEKLVEKVCEVNSEKYRAMTTETLALFSWLRRFAEGMIKKD